MAVVHILGMNCIEKMFIISALNNMGAEFTCFMNQKLGHLVSSVC